MSCPECDEAKRFAMDQARLRSQAQAQGVAVHVTRTQNTPVPPPRPSTALPAGPGTIRRG